MSTEDRKFLEIETKYDAENINRIEFKNLARSLNPKSFVYVESRDIYFVKNGEEFLRYRMPAESSQDPRAELTFKKKHAEKNNIIRTEVNLRIDLNSSELINAFCEGIGYKRNFSVYKICDIYYYDDADIVFYSVIDDFGKISHFLEIEVDERAECTEDEAWQIIQKYEKLLTPIGITAQKRKKLSLFEMYRKEIK